MVRPDGPLPAVLATLLSRVHKSSESTFYTLAPNIFGIIVRFFPCTQKLYMHRAESTKNSITVHSRILDPEYGTYFMSFFWHPEF
jgi:hypothetical protein